MKNPHIGSSLEEFLAEQGMLAEAQVAVAKRKVARQLADLMKKEKLTKDALAKRMKTSRAALDRLLDPDNPSVTLATLGKAACALGRTLRVELTDTAR
jgi:antitoxin HicB